MWSLEFWGITCFVFVALFTFRAYKLEPGKGQSPRSSIIEAWVNIVIGFTISYGANFLIFPLIGSHLTAGQNFWIGWIYTAISIVRQYTIRRWFNDHVHNMALRLAGDK